MNPKGVAALAVLTVVLLVPPSQATGRPVGTSVITASGGDRIEADVFRVASDGGRQVSGLAAYCLEAHSAIANARSIEDRDDGESGVADGGAGQPPTEPDLPHPDIPPDADADTTPCRGTSARLVSEPPGEPCPYGAAKAVAGYFYYDFDDRRFAFVSSAEYDTYRREGGDAGRWPAEHLCLDLFSGETDRASFEEVLEEPALWKSPDLMGLTGIDTWLWYDFAEPEAHTLSRAFTVDADGLALGVEATIWVDAVRWDMDGDAEWDVAVDLADTATAPASRDDYLAGGGREDAEAAAGAFVYESKGIYPVTVRIEWRGLYEYVGYPGNTGYYQPLAAESTSDYQVCEIVAVHIAPGADVDHPGCVPDP